ncbi:hypothetical protein HX049_17880 [Myroides odoratimimus]|uniref:hypothetical protein n=1 Tax=Myroides odoratimimus TaxID=76832 RepID=UPI002576D642|nr:hypothetical protein [Myroides odoratimimus]MDM1399006.1 hypothetical protein [Myroides odoratimimus]
MNEYDLYTIKDFTKFKKEFKLTNKDIASIIGTSEQNIKNLVTANKPLPSWARAFIYMCNNKAI